ncbi:MAG: leucine-rich repeat domain-containing protein [Christensenellales bacterium]|jgi:hypothetical protein
MTDNRKKVSILFSVLLCMCLLSGLTVAHLVLFASADAPDTTSVFEISSDGKTLLSYTGNATTLNIPVGIEKIAAGAFKNKTNLVYVLINSQTKIIEQKAFYGCTNLKNCVIPEDSNLTSIGFMTFARCGTLREINLPSKLTEIGDFAFLACSQITSFDLPESLQKIGEYAFMSCINITKFQISKNITSIGKGAFNYCIKLENFSVVEGCKNYSTANGVLFDKNKTTLIRYPIAKTAMAYTMPDTVKTVKTCAFWDNRSLKSITLGRNVTHMEKHSINYLSENTVLTDLYYPASKEPLLWRAIAYCPNLSLHPQ